MINSGEIGMRILARVIVSFIAFGMAGCMWGRMRVNDPDIVLRARSIRPGVTGMSELSRILNAQPTMRIPGKETTLLGYTYADTKSNGLVLLVVNFSRTQTVAETLYIEVDSVSGKVRKVYLPRKHDIEWRFWPFNED